MYAHVYDQGVKHAWIRSCNMSIDTLSGCYTCFVLQMDPNFDIFNKLANLMGPVMRLPNDSNNVTHTGAPNGAQNGAQYWPTLAPNMPM